MKTDRRVKYTKMVLKQSLLELLKNNSIDKITVKDICDLADINRGTFYKHYNDPLDLLFQIEGELFDKIKTALAKVQEQPTHSSDIYEILNCIAENSDLCKVLLGKFGDMDFIKKILYIANIQFVDEWSKKLDNPVLTEYLFSFIANGSVGIVQQWIQRELSEPVSFIADLIEELINNGLKSYSLTGAK